MKELIIMRHSLCDTVLAAVICVTLVQTGDCTPPGEKGPPIPSGTVYEIAYSPDGKYFVSVGGGNFQKWHNLVRIWDAKTHSEQARSSTRKVAVQSVDISPNGQLLAWAARGKYVVCRLGDPSTFLLTNKPNGNSAYDITFSPDSKIVALGGYYRTIDLFDIESGEQLGSLTGHDQAISALAFNPITGVLASGSGPQSISYDKSGKIRLWDVEQQKCLHVLDGHERTITDLCFSPDGKYLVSTSRDQAGKLWDAQTGKLLRTLLSIRGRTYCCEFSPDGKTLAIGGWGTDAPHLFDTETWQEKDLLIAEKGWATALAFSPDGQTIVTGGVGKLIIWDIKDGKKTAEIDLTLDESEAQEINKIVMLPEGPPEKAPAEQVQKP